jgi:hypothetical protein
MTNLYADVDELGIVDTDMWRRRALDDEREYAGDGTSIRNVASMRNVDVECGTLA